MFAKITVKDDWVYGIVNYINKKRTLYDGNLWYMYILLRYHQMNVSSYRFIKTF